jgi:hypothetical protein
VLLIGGAISVIGLLRSFRLGVWMTASEIVIRSWFVTHRRPVDGELKCAVVEYSGFINWMNTDGSGRWIKTLRITAVDLDVTANGLLASRKSAEAQAREINFQVASAMPNGEPNSVRFPSGGFRHKQSRHLRE